MRLCVAKDCLGPWWREVQAFKPGCSRQPDSQQVGVRLLQHCTPDWRTADCLTTRLCAKQDHQGSLLRWKAMRALFAKMVSLCRPAELGASTDSTISLLLCRRVDILHLDI